MALIGYSTVAYMTG